jgi:transmembrane sensor
MATSDLNTPLNTQIYEQASDWLVELRVGDIDAAARRRFDAWLRTSPEHIRAYLELSAIWEDGGDPNLDRDNSIESLIAQARAATNVIPLDSRSDSHAASVSLPDVSAGKKRVSRPWPIATAATVLLCLGGALSAWLYARANPTYATRIGEQKLVQLADGSTMELNSRSRVLVHFSKFERDVDLLEGQALFRVAKDHARPFIVHSDSTLVRAVGTQFDVYRKVSGTTVTVVEGRVAVLRDGGTPETSDSLSGGSANPVLSSSAAIDASSPVFPGIVYLSAGEQVTVTPAAKPHPTPANVAAATAWTQRRLVFTGTPLTDVAQEFNRYNVRQLAVRDADLEGFHVSGVFSSTDPTSLLRFLRAQQGIHVDETDAEIRISKE